MNSVFQRRLNDMSRRKESFQKNGGQCRYKMERYLAYLKRGKTTPSFVCKKAVLEKMSSHPLHACFAATGFDRVGVNVVTMPRYLDPQPNRVVRELRAGTISRYACTRYRDVSRRLGGNSNFGSHRLVKSLPSSPTSTCTADHPAYTLPDLDARRKDE